MSTKTGTKSKSGNNKNTSNSSPSKSPSKSASRSNSISRSASVSRSNSRSASASRSSSRSPVEKTPEKLELTDNGAFNSEDYDTLTQIQHLLQKPSTYIGNINKRERLEWAYVKVLEEKTSKVINEDGTETLVITEVEIPRLEQIITDVPEGLIHLYLEILANAIDAVISTRVSDPTAKCHIEITVDDKWIEITNYSKVIPIVKHKKLTDEYIPTVVFGTFYSSSNYGGKDGNKERHGAGTNGIGGKATNGFSGKFLVEINDPENNKNFFQKWTNNMQKTKGPEITKSEGPASFVRISYLADFPRFSVEGYSQDTIDILARIALENSKSAMVTIKFNEYTFKPDNIINYAKLFYGDLVQHPLIHYVWPEGTHITKNTRGIEKPDNPNVLPLLEMIAFDTPCKEGEEKLVYSNSIPNPQGGLHYETALKNISDLFIKKIKEKTKKVKININVRTVEKHITIILFARVIDPEYTSQTKTYLSQWSKTKGLQPADFKISQEEFDKATKSWQTINMLSREMETKDVAVLAKETDGKMSKRVVLNGESFDANKAGTKESHKCTGFVGEGESALSLIKAFGDLKYGRDYYGAISVQGKTINASNNTLEKIYGNKEIKQLKMFLGLKEGMEFPRDLHKLRYGKLIIATDADADGKHIHMLIYNYFNEFFPDLVEKVDFIYIFRTLIVKSIKGKTTEGFFSLTKYKEWAESEQAKGKWNTKYYKGLGSWTKKEITDPDEMSRIVLCNSTGKSWKIIQKVMDNKCANERKQWMLESKGYEEIDTDQLSVTIDEYINKEFIEYCFANVIRAIPYLSDGFKRSERKIVWQMLKVWGIGFARGANKSKSLPISTIVQPGVQKMDDDNKTSYKVSQFASSVAEHTEYHHGEKNLEDTIFGFTHDFPGSNNIPLMLPDAMCGSRNMGGKDHVSARYGFVKANWKLLPYIFHKQDSIILEMQEEEGTEIEPKFLLTTIPLVVVNGSEGIGTGWSTNLLPHDPLDVIKCLKRLLNGKEPSDVPPYFNWFKGTTEIIKKGTKPTCLREMQKVIVEENGRKVTRFEKTKGEVFDDIPDDKNEYTLITIGQWDYTKQNDIHVTELPIGVWTSDYYKHLVMLATGDTSKKTPDGKKQKTEKLIKDFRDCSTDEHIDFEIYNSAAKHTIKDFKLCQSHTLTNMHLLDMNDKPIRYRSGKHIIKAFYEFRLPFYEKRRLKLLEIIKNDIKYLNERMKFVVEIVEKRLEIRNRPKADIYKDMDDLQVGRSLLSEVSAIHFSKDEIEKLKQEIKNHKKLQVHYEERTARQLWIEDLDALEDAYTKYYEEKKEELDKSYIEMINRKKHGIKNTADAYDKSKLKGKGKGKEEV